MKNMKEAEYLIAEEKHVNKVTCLIYRLRARHTPEGTRFVLSVHTATESCEADAGTDFFAALSLYRKIIRGRVTPCTLPDIAQDFAFDQVKC